MKHEDVELLDELLEEVRDQLTTLDVPERDTNYTKDELISLIKNCPALN